MSIDFLKFAKDRYSVRKFKDTPLSDDVIKKIIECGHIAPTGCNYQPQRILVIKSKESLEKLKRCTKCHFDAPMAMLICYNKDELWVRPYDKALSCHHDATIVTTHMMLMAHSLGVGSCYVMHFNPTKMKEEFNIPENFIPHALLVMGYSDDNSKPLNLHTEKRNINEVVFYDSF